MAPPVSTGAVCLYALRTFGDTIMSDPPMTTTAAAPLKNDESDNVESKSSFTFHIQLSTQEGSLSMRVFFVLLLCTLAR